MTRKEIGKCKLNSGPPYLMRFMSTNLDISYPIKILGRSYRTNHKAFSQRTNLDISYPIKLLDRSYRTNHKAFSQRKNLDISYPIKILDRSYRTNHKAFSQRTVNTRQRPYICAQCLRGQATDAPMWAAIKNHLHM